MTITKETQAVTTVITGYKCDKCGKAISTDSDPMEFYNVISIKIVGGYGSKFGDGNEYSLDLCDECAHTVLKDYIKPIQ